MNLHELVKKERKRQGITQDKVYQSTGIPVARLISIEQGKGRLSLTELHNLLAYLNIRLLPVSKDSEFI